MRHNGRTKLQTSAYHWTAQFLQPILRQLVLLSPLFSTRTCMFILIVTQTCIKSHIFNEVEI